MKNTSVLTLKSFVVVILLGLFTFLNSCTNKDGSMSSIDSKIESQKVQCLISVYSYSYKGEKVYLFNNGDCPDFGYFLYDSEGNLVCSPSGGLSGLGDGKCPDFDSVATNETLYWSK